MDIIEFSKNISKDNLINILEKHFEQHLAMYSMSKLNGGLIYNINASLDIDDNLIYTISSDDESELINIKNTILDYTSTVYGSTYTAKVVDEDKNSIKIIITSED